MKTIFLPVFIISAMLMISGVVIFQSDTMESTTLNFISEVIHVFVIIIILIIGIVLANKRRRLEKAGLALDDELSDRILCRTGLISFYGTLILWLILLYIQMKSSLFTGLVFSYGFIGMALIFVIIWIVYNSKGLNDE